MQNLQTKTEAISLQNGKIQAHSEQYKFVDIDNYIVDLLELVKKESSCQIILDSEWIKLIESKLKFTYWSAYDKKHLSFYLQEYIQFSLQILRQQANISETQNKIRQFVQNFSLNIMKLCQNIQKKHKSVMQSLGNLKWIEECRCVSNLQISQCLLITQKLNTKQCFSDFLIPFCYLKYIQHHKLGTPELIDNLLNTSYHKSYYYEYCHAKNLYSSQQKISGDTKLLKNEKLKAYKQAIKAFQQEIKLKKTQFTYKNIQHNKNIENIQKYIIELAEYAQKNHDYLESIIFNSCMSSFGFNFKSYHRVKNSKDIRSIRKIIMEMLIKNKKKSFKKFVQDNGCKISDIPKNVQLYIKQCLQTQKQNSIKFQITDILQFKCDFSSDADKIICLLKISEKIKQEQAKGKNIHIINFIMKTKKIIISIDNLIFQVELITQQFQLDYQVKKQINFAFDTEIYWAFNQWFRQSGSKYIQIVKQHMKYANNLQIFNILKKFQQKLTIDEQKLKKNVILSKNFNNSIKQLKETQALKKSLQNIKIQNNMVFMRANKNPQYLIQIFNNLYKNNIQNILNLKQLEQIGSVYLKQGDFSQARNIYNKIISQLQKQNKKETLYYSNTVQKLAEIELQTKNLQKSLILCKQSLSIKQKIVGKKNAEYVSCLMKMGDIHKSLNKIQQSYKFYDQAQRQYYPLNNQDLLYAQIELKKSEAYSLTLANKKKIGYVLSALSCIKNIQSYYGLLSQQSFNILQICSNIILEELQKAENYFNENPGNAQIFLKKAYIYLLSKVNNNQQNKQILIKYWKGLLIVSQKYRNKNYSPLTYQQQLYSRVIQIYSQNKSILNMDMANLLSLTDQKQESLQLIQIIKGKNCQQYLKLLERSHNSTDFQILQNYTQIMSVSEKIYGKNDSAKYIEILKKLQKALKDPRESNIINIKLLKIIQKQKEIQSKQWIQFAKTIAKSAQLEIKIPLYKKLLQSYWKSYTNKKSSQLLYKYLQCLYLIAKQYIRQTPSFNKYCDKALKTYQQQQEFVNYDSKQLFNTIYSQRNYYRRQKKYQQGIQFYSNLLKSVNKSKLGQKLWLYQNISEFYKLLNNNKNSVQIYNQALKIIDVNQNIQRQKDLVKIYLLIAKANQNCQNYNESIQNNMKCLELLTSLKEKDNPSQYKYKIFQNLMRLYVKIKKSQQIIEMLKKQIQLEQNYQGILFWTFKIADVFILQGKLNEANKICQETIVDQKIKSMKFPNKFYYVIAHIINRIKEIYTKTGNKSKVQHFEKVLK